MYLEQHEESTLNKLGNKCTEVHKKLDYYFPYFRTEAHRVIFHHKIGAQKVAKSLAHLYGYELAYNAAKQHILDDMGILYYSWYNCSKGLVFVHEIEYDLAIQILYTEYPLSQVNITKKIIY